MTDGLQVLGLLFIFAALGLLWAALGEKPPTRECKVVVLAEHEHIKGCRRYGWGAGPGVAVQDEAGHVWEICTRAPVGTSLLTQCEWRR